MTVEMDSGSLTDVDDLESFIGPVLPPKIRTAGAVDSAPLEKPSFTSTGINNDEPSAVSVLKEDDDNVLQPAPVSDYYGPALPPPGQHDEQVIVGPTLPTWFNASNNSSSEESEDEIGPMPVPDGESMDAGSAQRDIERRAKMMKDKLTNKGGSEELQREEWMTVLPPELSKNFGLGPRTFQRRTPRPTGDRSGWTDTPADKLEKEKTAQSTMPADDTDAEILAHSYQQKYDEEMEKITEEHNKKKRAESLLIIHKKGLKRKAGKEKAKSTERRPFDRDVDLKVNAMDEAKRKALIKQSRQLNDKFSSGKSQFL